VASVGRASARTDTRRLSGARSQCEALPTVPKHTCRLSPAYGLSRSWQLGGYHTYFRLLLSVLAAGGVKSTAWRSETACRAFKSGVAEPRCRSQIPRTDRDLTATRREVQGENREAASRKLQAVSGRNRGGPHHGGTEAGEKSKKL